METAKSGQRAVAGRGRKQVLPTTGKSAGFAKTDPRSRATNRSIRAFDYASFANEIYRDLNPQGSLEKLVADHVVHSAWKLKTNLENQGILDRASQADFEAKPAKVRVRSTELDRASRSLREALESLDYLRNRVLTTPRIVDEAHEVNEDILSNEWPVVPCDDFDNFVEAPEVLEVEEEVVNWQDRLVFDFDISDISPVVKGTWITVSHVVSLIVDGWNWADILRAHPELVEDDIRTCVAYAMSEENAAP